MEFSVHPIQSRQDTTAVKTASARAVLGATREHSPLRHVKEVGEVQHRGGTGNIIFVDSRMQLL